MRTKSRTTVFLTLLVLIGCTLGSAQEAKVGNLSGNQRRGHDLYQRYCIYCHGKYGDGQGENALYLDPKPRDFTTAVFKCRSTPTGTLPLDSDLYDTISRGVHGSGMPSWKPLTRQERVDLIAYIKSFSPKFAEEKPGMAIVIPDEPPNSPESGTRGSELFQSMNCWQCHGKEGHGNGPSAASLTDSKGHPITPADLTNSTKLKCGESDKGIFRDLTTGLDGTPMPSFSDALKPDQIWDLVHYIATLRRGKDSPKSELGASNGTH